MSHYKNRGGCLAALLVALTAMQVPRALAQEVSPDVRAPQLPQRRLTVTGVGEVRRKPDKADILIGVVTERKTSQAAATANAEASSAVVAAVKRTGVADRDIQTVTYAVEPLTAEQPGHNGPIITGYRVTNRVQVTIRDIAHVGELLDATTAAGANTVESIQFGLEEMKAAQDDALEQAVLDARRKADRIVRASGATLLGIYEISEGSNYGPVMGSFAAARAEVGVATPIQTGESTIRANVTMVFQIGPSLKAAQMPRPNGQQSASRRLPRPVTVHQKTTALTHKSYPSLLAGRAALLFPPLGKGRVREGFCASLYGPMVRKKTLAKLGFVACVKTATKPVAAGISD